MRRSSCSRASRKLVGLVQKAFAESTLMEATANAILRVR